MVQRPGVPDQTVRWIFLQKHFTMFTWNSLRKYLWKGLWRLKYYHQLFLFYLFRARVSARRHSVPKKENGFCLLTERERGLNSAVMWMYEMAKSKKKKCYYVYNIWENFIAHFWKMLFFELSEAVTEKLLDIVQWNLAYIIIVCISRGCQRDFDLNITVFVECWNKHANFKHFDARFLYPSKTKNICKT
jgi:hypothetical protein